MTTSATEPTAVPDWVRDMYTQVDAGAVDRYIDLFDDDAELRFGSAPAVRGKETIRAALKAADSGHQLQHTLLNCWQVDDMTILEFDVNYHYDDGTSASFPAITLLRRGNGGINSMRVYFNPGPSS
jgi:ketosteroid isomerase-like protein